MKWCKGRLLAERPLTEEAALMLCGQGLGEGKRNTAGIYITNCAKLKQSGHAQISDNRYIDGVVLRLRA